MNSISAASKNVLTKKGVALAADFGIGTYGRVKDGSGLMSAIGREAISSALWATQPHLMTGIMAAQFAVQGTQAAYAFRRQAHTKFTGMLESAGSNQVGGGYMDTNQAATMRQAAFQQIQGNKINARSALGGEARIFANNRY